MATRRIGQKQIKDALWAAAGNLSAAAQILGLSRQALVERTNRNPELVRARDEAREVLFDVAQRNVVELLKRGDPPTSRWVLQHSGRFDRPTAPIAAVAAPQPSQRVHVTIEYISTGTRLVED